MELLNKLVALQNQPPQPYLRFNIKKNNKDKYKLKYYRAKKWISAPQTTRQPSTMSLICECKSFYLTFGEEIIATQLHVPIFM